MPLKGIQDDYAIRRGITDNAKAEAGKIYKKLNAKGDYDKTAYAANQNTGKKTRFWQRAMGAGGSAEKAAANAKSNTARKMIEKQVVTTRMKQYTDQQKSIASKMGVNLPSQK